ncbi:hypothetical protein V8E54_007763, partial [Elaphomyces granulatus]
HGEKWRHTPQLNRPMERIDIADLIRDVRIGDVLELHESTTGFKYAMYMECEIHVKAGVREKFYQILKLTSSDDESRYYISTQNASPRLDADAITLVTEDIILDHVPISKFGPIYGVDSKNGGINLIEDAWIKPHPARALCESTGRTTDRQINVSIWNDGLSGVRSKRWNPFEVWTVTLAGLTRTNNFHPSQNFFLAAGRHIKATDMIQPVVEQLVRLQRGIQAFDATTGRKIVICGGLVMGTGDNPAASDLCAHSWQSNRVNPHLDWMYDVLHGALLGYVKYLWTATINDSEIKKDLEALCLQFATLTVLLYQTEITDIDLWSHSISTTALDLIEVWSAQWGLDELKNKTKFHHLAHLSMWAKRFGPTIVGTAETNEAANKRIRRHLSLSNRQAGSRDLANKLATAQGIQFLAQEGTWKVSKDAVTMTRPGSALRELCRVPEVRDLVGLSTPGNQAKADVLFHIRKNNVAQSISGHLIKST